jgi:hypothetical protein
VSRGRGTAPSDGNLTECVAGTSASVPMCRGISRSELFAALFLLGIVNALAAVLFPLVHSESPWQALAQLSSSISIVAVAATVVGVHLLRQSPDAPIKLCDCLAAATVALLLLVPHRAASWLAVTGLALFSLGRDRQSTTAVAAASVFLAIAASSFWGPVLAQIFASTLLPLDASLAAGMLNVLTGGGVGRLGNVIVTGDQQALVVLAGCSSLPNLFYGCLCWTAIARALRPAWQLADMFALLAVGVLVLVANATRVALMGLSAESYVWVHGPVGGNVFNFGLLLAIVAVALHSTRPAASSLDRWRSASRGGEPLW